MDDKSRILKRIPLERMMDLKVDYAFKQLFGNERNKKITVVFLNAVLKRTGANQIKDIRFSATEAGGEYEEDKKSRLDLLVVTNAEEWINVEIQFTNQYDMVNRSIYYWAGVYRKPMKPKMGYKELNAVIAINLLNFSLFSQTEKFHTTFHLFEDEEKFKLTNMMEFHFIEMSKLLKDWKENKLNPWDDVLARWLLLLGIVDRRNGKVYDELYKELEEIAMKDETLHSAFQSWEALSSTPKEILAYESRLKRVMDEEAAVREAELRIQEAKQKAEQRVQETERRAEQRIQEAEQKAQETMRKAEQKAVLQVQQSEMKTKYQIARKLLAKRTSIGDIMDITDLDEQTILTIQNEQHFTNE